MAEGKDLRVVDQFENASGWVVGSALLVPMAGAVDGEGVAAGLHSDNYKNTAISAITSLKVRVKSEGSGIGPRVVLRTAQAGPRPACNIVFQMPNIAAFTTFDLTSDTNAFWSVEDAGSPQCIALGLNGSTWTQVKAALPGQLDRLDSTATDGVAGVRILAGSIGVTAYATAYVDWFEFNGETSDFDAPTVKLGGAVASIPAGGTIDLPIASTLSGPNQPGFGNSLGFVSGKGGVVSAATVSVASSPAGLCTTANAPFSFTPTETSGMNLGTSFSKVLPSIKVTTVAGAGGTCTFSLVSPVNAIVSGSVTLTVTATPTLPAVVVPPVVVPPVVPTTCVASAVSHKSKFKVDMGPDLPGDGYYLVRIEVKKSGKWFRYLKFAKTEGPTETKTVNVPKGTYRAKCYGPTEAQNSRSNVVKIKK